jgi:rhodanese-related sulfurtransferase
MPRKLTPDELGAMLAECGDKVLIDVRDPVQIRQKGTIQGHINIPFKDLEQRIGELPKDKKIITACNRGGSAGRAAKLLEEHGYNVLGSAGVEEWKEKGNPVVYPGKV